MDQKEHAGTLCALGTVGIAAAGLTLGITEGDAYLVRPGKRKWPGAEAASPLISFQTPNNARRTVSQPTSVRPQSVSNPSTSESTSSRRGPRDSRLTNHMGEEDDDQKSESRASSASRRSILRPWTADTKSSTERREASSSSSWLKRMSSLSSTHGSSTASSIQHDHPHTSEMKLEGTNRPFTSDHTPPNKLVKRATSQRALTREHANGQILRRPATSHQRSYTSATSSNTDILSQSAVSSLQSRYEQPSSTLAATKQVWRPFFTTNNYSRKRRNSNALLQDAQIRTIAVPYLRCPTLLLGTQVENHVTDDIEQDQDRVVSSPPLETKPLNKHKLRRSLSSIRRSQRRRNYTDPTAQISRSEANGFIVQSNQQSSLSPLSNISAFEVDLPPGTPSFTSSPPMTRSDFSFTVRKRSSPGLSEPRTTSSDNDPRVFTDDDSMDMHSDTNYDSIATRATSSGRTGLRISRLETIFAERHSDEMENKAMTLEDLMKRTSLQDREMPDTSADSNTTATHETSVASIHDGPNPDGRVSTPLSSDSIDMEDVNATPVPVKPASDTLLSSPLLFPIPQNTKSFDSVGDMINDVEMDGSNDIDWSPDPPLTSVQRRREDSPLTFWSDQQHLPEYLHESLQAGSGEPQDSRSDIRSSIFDWSEQQQTGSSPRPRTVHGKQANDHRSRSSGRKELHLRSQSVPVAREPLKEDTPQSSSKFSTWGLGHKPVSEEWSDDFDFDDNEDEPPMQLNHNEQQLTGHDSVRSVKVPQSIMDRQASVHLQFGQVQEFMLLVEELKRLRARGAALDLFQSNSKQLWEDADSIINLATINDEDEKSAAPTSPTSSDIFGDDFHNGSRPAKESNPFGESKRPTATRRSISTSVTSSLVGRARGDSLAQAKNFLQNIHQNRAGIESHPREIEIHQQKKLPFDTQDLRDLVVRSGVITRALMDIVRHAEGISISPQKTPPKNRDPPFSQIFNVPEEGDGSPCPPFRKPVLPKSRSANSYLETSTTENSQSDTFSARLSLTAMV